MLVALYIFFNYYFFFPHISDSITLYYFNSTGMYEEVPLNGKGIAWWTDYNIKFQNPKDGNKTLAEIFQGDVKNKKWLKYVNIN